MIKKANRDEFLSLLEDSSNMSGGFADLAVFPQDPSEVIEFLQEANSKGVAVTISGGGTGVTGGRIPFGGSVISCELLNKIIDIKSFHDKKVIVLQPGVSWENFRLKLDKDKLWFGPDPTEDKAFVAGAVSTNASGARSFKYGPIRNYINRLTLILADGSTLDVKRNQVFSTKDGVFNFGLTNGKRFDFKTPDYIMPNIKNAAGYFVKRPMDLIDLFIGQEGTLAFISEIELALLERPEKILGFFIFFDKDSRFLDFLEDIKKVSKERFTENNLHDIDVEAMSIEYFDENSLELLRKDYPNLPTGCAALFIEQEVKEKDEGILIDKWAKFLERYNISMDDVWFADNPRDERLFRDIRHSLPEKVNDIVRQNKRPKVGTDIAVPDNAFKEMFKFYMDKLKRCTIPYVIFGHISDNHLHVNVLPKTEAELNYAKTLYMEFVKKAVSLQGTVSAEHGIGKLKTHFLSQMYGIDAVKEMVRLKKVFDPKGILNQGNIFPKELL